MATHLLLEHRGKYSKLPKTKFLTHGDPHNPTNEGPLCIIRNTSHQISLKKWNYSCVCLFFSLVPPPQDTVCTCTLYPHFVQSAVFVPSTTNNRQSKYGPQKQKRTAKEYCFYCKKKETRKHEIETLEFSRFNANMLKFIIKENNLTIIEMHWKLMIM